MPTTGHMDYSTNVNGVYVPDTPASSPSSVAADGYAALAKASAVTNIPYSAPGGTIMQGMMPANSTVVSNYNYANNTKPKLDSQLQQLSQKGNIVGSDGVSRDANGNVVSQAPQMPSTDGYQGQLENGFLPGTQNDYTLSDPDPVTGERRYYKYSSDPAQERLYQSMVSNLDANTKSQLDAIEKQRAVILAQQEQSNKSQLAGRAQSLLMGGGAKFAQQSAGNEIKILTDYGIQQIAALNAQEDNLVAQAKNAQASGNQAIFQSALAEAQRVRQEKQAAAQKIVEAQAAEIKKQRENSELVNRGTAIAEIMSQFPDATEPQILKALNDMGYKITAKELTDTFKSLSPDGTKQKITGDLGQYFELVKQGIPLPDFIMALPENQRPFAYVKFMHDLGVKDSTKKGTTDSNGNLLGGTPDPNYSMVVETWTSLVDTGLKVQEVGKLQNDIQIHGLKAVLNNPDSGLDDFQKGILVRDYNLAKEASKSGGALDF